MLSARPECAAFFLKAGFAFFYMKLLHNSCAIM